MTTEKKWTYEVIAQKTRKALKESGVIKLIDPKKDDEPLDIDSFGWSSFWVCLEQELGTSMNFDPKDGGLTTMVNCNTNDIICFLYKKLNEQENYKSATKKIQSMMENL